MAGADDVRLTIRTREDDLTGAVMTTLHEGGHGLYDQGFLPGDRDSLLGESPSMGLHESQSRLWENHVGRSLAFWQHLFPAIRSLFPEAAAKWNLADGAADLRADVEAICGQADRSIARTVIKRDNNTVAGQTDFV